MRIVIIDQKGQLANRLLLSASFFAYCEEYGYQFVYPHFDVYAPYFAWPIKGRLRVYFSTIPWIHKLVIKLFFPVRIKFMYKLSRLPNAKVAIVDVRKYDHTKKEFMLNQPHLGLDKPYRTVLVQGWSFRNPQLVEKHRKEIIAYMMPKQYYMDSAKRWRDSVMDQKHQTVLVGIHMRLGDFKDFEGGRYYYEVKVYEKLVSHIRSILPNASFVVFSNESVDISIPGLYIQRSGGNAMEDLVRMSMCHYIAGPPSTFSICAAFVGHALLYHMHYATSMPALEEFQEVVSF